MNKSITIGITVALIVVAVFVGLTVQSFQGEAVARIDGEKITQEDLYKSMIKQDGQQALQGLIAQKIVDLEAKKNNIIVTPAAIQEKIKDYQDAYGGEQGLLSALQSSNITMDDLKSNIDMSLKVTGILLPQITISDEEIAKYFTDNKASIAPDVKDPKLEDYKAKIKEYILEQKVQSKYDSWLQERETAYNVETLI